MTEPGLKNLIDAARHFNSNRHHLDSPDNTARYYAERCRDDLFDAAAGADIAARQHRMLLEGLASVLNRVRDTDAHGCGHHFQSIASVGDALEAVLRKYDNEVTGG